MGDFQDQLDPEIRALMDETLADIARGELNPPRVPWEWELRRSGELTTEYLGRVLEWAGAPTVFAANARMGHYDDYFAPAEIADGMEILRLVRDLRRLARAGGDAERLAAVENAAKWGELDATKAESDRWAASKDGQETFAELTGQAHANFSQMLKDVGRNDQCPCGSGLKFKRCHGA
jgi:hypothetical protein